MIYSLRGTLALAQPGTAVVECGGVGYLCSISLTTLSALPPVGSEVTLYTYLAIREDALDLFGFYDRSELALFRLLTSVTGVGARLALALLSDFSPDRLTLQIAAGDAKSLTSAAGVGNKIAQRIVLELKDKVGGISENGALAEQTNAAAADTGAVGEAIAALMALGYSQTDAAVALHGAPAGESVEELIRMGLKQLSRRG